MDDAKDNWLEAISSGNVIARRSLL